ncbi:polysaccharide deacetylase family protein [Oceanospirillum sp.]|uniref:polysaccharide deacetylase family protein n=1 Tax=Oceanospirillum sp. TaxID=2021254 RepID=UPI003A947711
MRLSLLGSTVLGLSLIGSQVQAKEVAERHHASVLMYHHISAETPRSTSTDAETFTRHLDLLDQLGFQVWPLPRVAEHLKANKPLPDKIAVLTFDDAYISVYDTALPIMSARKLPFTIFVNATPINQGNKLYMSWDQLREAKAKGATIGNHSLYHEHMIRKRADEDDVQWLVRMRAEITENQRQLEKHLGVLSETKLFAYPYGEFNPALESLLADLGYIAFGQQSGAASPFTSLQGAPRYAANGIYSNPDSLKTKLLALPFPVRSETPRSGVLAPDKRSPVLTLTLEKGDYRLDQLRCYGPAGEVLQVTSEDQADGAVKLQIATEKTLPAGRHRYNCTAPHRSESRWFWFSRQWMLPEPDGRWYKG